MFGDVEQDIRQRCEATGSPLPEIVANAPVLAFGDLWYYEVWTELSNDRQVGFGCGPIPSISITEYGKAENLTSQEISDLRYILRKMDEEYFIYQEKKSKDK